MLRWWLQASVAGARNLLLVSGPVRAKRPVAADSLLDTLTGVANRRALETQMRWEWARAAAQGRPTALLVLQIDHFEQYEGHHRDPGEACLRRIATVLASAAGEGVGLLARLSAWEFALLLPDTDEAGAIAVGERLRRAVAGAGLPHSGSCWGLVTVSVGCAAVTPATGNAPGMLLAEADAALQRARSEGHNRVAFSLPSAFRWPAAFHQQFRQAAGVADTHPGVPGWSGEAAVLHSAVA